MLEILMMIVIFGLAALLGSMLNVSKRDSDYMSGEDGQSDDVDQFDR
jgi:hypothetical protein